MPTTSQWVAAKARQTFYAALRSFLTGQGYLEVETPALVPFPGMEPHIDAFEVPFVPQGAGQARRLYLHTSPEYAMKRLLADPACPPLFQICKVFRNGELALAHNPEFSMLEMYRPNAGYEEIMADLEQALSMAERALLGGPALFGRLPFERRTIRDAVLAESGVDIARCPNAQSLAAAAETVGIRAGPTDGFEDIFFRLFLEKVEPKLGLDRPVFLMDYPRSMASLARLKPTDSSVAERFELYARGLELGNGFSELTDAVEQRQRLVAEQAERTRENRPVYDLDEAFLEAVGKMPPSGGVAVGLDRVLMLLLRAKDIADVLFFPARGFL